MINKMSTTEWRLMGAKMVEDPTNSSS